MKKLIIRLLVLASVVCGLSSCAIVIEDHAPRWKCSLKCNGVAENYECVEDTYPVSMEYAVPEFFIMEDGKVVFRFFYKEIGLELQAASDKPFKNGKKYSFSAGDEFFDVSFDWLYNGKDFSCDSGTMQFNRSILPGIAYTINFEFNLSAPGGSKMEIRSGVFTVYDKVQPRNTDIGLR